MSNKLPQGWVECQLGQVFKIINGDRGKNYPAKNKLHTSGIPFVSAINIQNSELSVENLLCLNEQQYDLLRSGKINKGDTLLCIRGSIGKHCIYQLDKGAIASSMVIIRQIAPSIDKFLFYYLESFCFRQEVKKYDNGTAQPNLSATDLKKFNYPLPPRNEQRRIVEKIESEFKKIDEGLEYLLITKDKIKQYRQSVLKSAFEGKLYKTSKWKETTLNKCTTKLGDGLHGTPEYSDYGDFYFINGNNLNDGMIEIKKDTKKVNFEEYQKYKKELNNNTVLVSINGTIGNTAFYNNEKVILGKSACYFNLANNIDKYFIRYLLKTNYFLNYANKNATGSTIKNVSLKVMREFSFYLPTLEEQQKIVEEIETRFALADKVEKVVDDNIKQAKQLKQSILKKAFEGRLVPQDPTDEPASVLLEKIKKEKNNDRK